MWEIAPYLTYYLCGCDLVILSDGAGFVTCEIGCGMLGSSLIRDSHESRLTRRHVELKVK
jgi:hypothetical protein